MHIARKRCVNKKALGSRTFATELFDLKPMPKCTHGKHINFSACAYTLCNLQCKLTVLPHVSRKAHTCICSHSLRPILYSFRSVRALKQVHICLTSTANRLPIAESLNRLKLNAKIAYNSQSLQKIQLKPLFGALMHVLTRKKTVFKNLETRKKEKTKEYQADRLAKCSLALPPSLTCSSLSFDFHHIKKLKKQLKIWFMIYLFALGEL